MYCDIKHIVNVNDEDGTKVEESMMKHDKIFLGEASCTLGMLAWDTIDHCSFPTWHSLLKLCSVCDWQHAVWQCLQVPIMLRSDYCSLHDQDDMQLQDLGECPYDQVPMKCTSCVSCHLSLSS